MSVPAHSVCISVLLRNTFPVLVENNLKWINAP